MAYTKTVYVNDNPPAINADNLNKMEQGIYDADFIANNSGPEYFTDGSFGFHVAMDNTASTGANPILAILNMKNRLAVTTIKVKVSYIIHSFSSWNYFSLRYGNTMANANQRIRTIQTGVSLDTVITDTVEFTPTMAITFMRLYFEKGSAIGIKAELLNVEIYVDGVYTGYFIDTANAPAYTTVTINPKGQIATLEYVKENYATGKSNIDSGKYLLPKYYVVCPDIRKANMVGINLYADWITYDGKILFDNMNDHICIYPPLSQTNNVEDTTKQLSFVYDRTAKPADQTIHVISTKESVTNKQQRILVIGDSVTAGYGAENEDYVKRLYKYLKINAVLNESDINPVFLGTHPKNVSFVFDDVTYTDHLGCEGYSGYSLRDFYLTDKTPFYDESASGDCKFSINKWLSDYRTMDDNGNRLSLDDPAIGSKVTAATLDTYNVCMPNIVVINLGHNDFYQGYTSNMNYFFTMYSEVMDVIRSQCPSAHIIVCATMSLLKCLYPDLHPNYRGIDANPNTPNYINRYKLNIEHWKEFIEDNTDSKIHVMPEWNITPTINAYKWYRTDNEFEEKYYTTNEFGSAHPYIPAHEVYAYELFAMCQYIKTLMS